MSSKGLLTLFLISFFCICIFESCNNPKPPETAIVNTPEELEVKASDIIRSSINYAIEKEGKIDDSIQLGNIKLGRLPQDSISQRKDSVLADDFYLPLIQQVQQKGVLTEVFQSLEPRHQGYRSLKEGIKKFLDSADNKIYTIVPSRMDTSNFKEALKKRLFEGGFFANDSMAVDSAQLTQAVKAFQRS